MLMRYLGGAPGHSRRGSSMAPHMQPAPSETDLAADGEDPSDEECEYMQPVARRHHCQPAEEGEEWSDDEYDIQDAPPDLDSEDEELPGNDEYTYSLAGMTL